jgi:hypothetical protein
MTERKSREAGSEFAGSSPSWHGIPAGILELACAPAWNSR